MTHCLYERAAEVLARLRGCAGSPEPSLLAYAISTKFAWRGPYKTFVNTKMSWIIMHNMHMVKEYINTTLLTSKLVPIVETRDFDSWLTSSLRIECNFHLATSDVQMMPETKFYFQVTNEQNK